VHEVVQLPVLSRQSVQLVDVELAELFNVHGPALFVGLVVELGIVLVDFGLFGVVEAVSASQLNVHADVHRQRQRRRRRSSAKLYFFLRAMRQSIPSNHPIAPYKPAVHTMNRKNRRTQQYHPPQTPSSTPHSSPTSTAPPPSQTCAPARNGAASDHRNGHSPTRRS
jgi:hypothetical protein